MQVPLGVLTQQKPEDKTANTLEQIIRFCLNLNKRAHIELNKFEKISYFSLISRSEGCISSATFYFFYIESLVYMKDVFKQPDHPNSILSQIESTFAKNQSRTKKTSFCSAQYLEQPTRFFKTTKGLNTYKLLLIDFTYFSITICCFLIIIIFAVFIIIVIILITNIITIIITVIYC